MESKAFPEVMSKKATNLCEKKFRKNVFLTSGILSQDHLWMVRKVELMKKKRTKNNSSRSRTCDFRVISTTL